MENKSANKFSFFTFSIFLFFNWQSLTAQGFDHTHAGLNTILNKVVISGLVDYKTLSKDRNPLTQYLKSLSSVTEAEYKDFNKNQKMAFLINAYNAYTLELILNHYPLKSIGDIGGPIRLVNLARGTPWKKFKFSLLGEERTLDWIEHSKLRIDFADPRIHFAINCASIGCPALHKESYTAKNLDVQLQNAMVNFLSDRKKNSYDKDRKILKLSKIFDWFREDFEKKSTSVINFIKQSFPEPITGDAEIEYSDYDWNLNEAK